MSGHITVKTMGPLLIWIGFAIGFASNIFAQRYRPAPRDRAPVTNRHAQQAVTTRNTVLEAESLQPKVSAGNLIKQDMRQFGTWSGNQQVLWVGNRAGHRLELPFQSPRAGRFQVTAYLTKASDFADVAIGFRGRQLATFSGYNRTVVRAPVTLGQLDLRAGTNTLIFNVTGKNRLSTNYRIGIDSIEVDFGTEIARAPDTIRIPNSSDQITNQWTPSTNMDARPEAKNPDRFSDIQIKLAGGADLLVPNGDFALRSPQELRTGQYVLRLRQNVSKVPNAGAAILQVSRTPFPEDAEGDGYPQMQPTGLAYSGLVINTVSDFNVDVRRFVRSSLLPKPAKFHVRIIPVISKNDRRIVGKASNVVEIYYNQSAPSVQIDFVKHLQADAFADLLESKLAGKTSGYAIAIIPKGKPAIYRAGGLARSSADGTPKAMTVHDRTNLASVTKLVTAIMIVKALDANPNVSLESKIAPFLPASWTKGPNVETITFRELLRHYSGLRSTSADSNDDAGLQQVIERGVPDLAEKKKFKYVNQNFGLMRVLLPRIKLIQGTGGDSEKFVREANLSVLGPAGIAWVPGTPDANTALSYPFPASKTKGTNWSAKLDYVGSSGLHMSAAEIAKFMERLVNSNAVLRPDLREELIGWNMGCTKRSDVAGRCFGKGGYLRSRSAKSSSPSERAELNTMAYAFSDGTVVGLIVNSSWESSPNAPPSFDVLLRNCFKECYREF